MPHLSQLISAVDLGLHLIQSGAQDAEITWVGRAETPTEFAYAGPGALILTTGAEFSDDDPRWRDLVAALSRARVTGLVLECSTKIHPHVPGALVQSCSEYQLALLEMPRGTPGIAVSRAVDQLRRADGLRFARESLLAQQSILDQAFDGTGPAGVVAAVSSATGRQVAVLEHDGRRVAATAGFAAAFSEHGDSGVSGFALEIGAGRRIVAAGGPLDADDRAALTAAAIVLNVEARSDTQNTVVERERWGRLTRALLVGDPQATEFAALLDPEFILPEHVRVLVVRGGAEEVAAWRSTTRTGTERLVTRYPLDEPGRVRYAPTGGTVLAWQIVPVPVPAALPPPAPAQAPSPHAESLELALAQAAHHGLQVVVGAEVALAQCAISRRSAEARLATMARSTPHMSGLNTPSVTWAPESSPITQLMLGDNAAGLGQAVLGPLASMSAGTDAGTGTGTGAEPDMLRATLTAFLAHHGQRGPAADELGIHRNTLRARIARIETMLGRSLENPDDRAELWIALRTTDAVR